MTRIVLDGIHAHPGGTGLARYAREVLSRLIVRLRDHEVLVLVTPETDLPDTVPTMAAPATISPRRGGKGHLARAAWRELVLPRKLAENGIDLYYTPVPELPPGRRRMVATVHDLIPLEYPRMHWKQFCLFAWNVDRLRARADTIIAISGETRDRLANRWRRRATPPFRVIPNGTSAPVAEQDDPDNADGDQSPYLLFVGDARPYKGLVTVLGALAHTRSDVRLQVAGHVKPTWLRQILADCDPDVLARVDLLDYVDDERLDRLYRGARAVVCPSEVEGFGLVPLEAMRRGTPAIVSDIPVFRETLSGQANFAPVGDAKAWADAIDSLVTTERQSPSPAELAAFASTFDWDRTAAGIERAIRVQLGEIQADEPSAYDSPCMERNKERPE